MTAGTKQHRIALVFEYATLNGGERSMLASLDWIRANDPRLDFVAIAPEKGRLAESLAQREIDVIPWAIGTDSVRPSREEIDARLLAAIANAKADLVHANSLAMGRLTGRIAERLSIATSSHLRDIIHLSGAAISDMNRNRRLIAVSQATRDAHVARGIDPQRVVVVRNGLNLNEYQPRPRSGWLRQDLRLPDSAILITTIGQIGLRKGQDVLALAAPAIVQVFPETHFLLIGERSSTKAESIEFEQGIEARFHEFNLQSHLHRLGYRDDVATLLSEVDLIVHPANQEPFGRVLLEAAACGVPVVATNVGGTSEIVIDGVTGCLVPPRDPAQLTRAVIGLLSNQPLLRAMGQAARDRAVQEFDIAISAARLVDQWRSLVTN